MKKSSVDFLVKAGLIGAAYIALTVVLAPLSYSVMQVRVSEALTALAVFTPAAIPGLTVGCFISGILGPNGLIDALLGSAATLIGVSCTYALRRYKYLAPTANVFSNAVIIGGMLSEIYHVGLSFWTCALWVGIGEAISCLGIGSIIIKYIFLRKKDIVGHKQ